MWIFYVPMISMSFHFQSLRFMSIVKKLNKLIHFVYLLYTQLPVKAILTEYAKNL